MEPHLGPRRSYKVLVDDNFHYMDPVHRRQLGEFEHCECAMAACRKIVEDCLLDAYEPGVSAGELWEIYQAFGEEPFIVSADGSCAFSAWDYARRRCEALCAAVEGRDG